MAKIKKSNSTKKQYTWLFIGMFLVFILAPLMGDDMTFSAETKGLGLKGIFDFSYYYGNGRLLGNMVVMLLTKSRFFYAVGKAFVLSSMVYLINRLLDIKSYAGFALTSILVVLPGVRFFSRVYSWTAGFSNYVIPVMLALFCMFIIKQCADKSVSKVVFSCIAVFLFGTSAQLFSENTTVFIVFLAIYLFVIALKQHSKKAIASTYCFLAGSVVGAALMYVIPKLSQTDGDLNWYRSTAFSSDLGLFKTVLSHYNTVAMYINKSILIWITISVCLFIAMRGSEKYATMKKAKKGFLCTVLVLQPAFAAFNTLFYGSYVTSFNYILPLIVIVQALYLLAILFIILDCLTGEQKRKALTCFLFIILSVLPLLVVSPIGQRTIYLTYAVGIFFALYLVKTQLAPLIPDELVTGILQKAAKATLMSAFAILIVLYFEITTVEMGVRVHIEEEMEAGKKTIYIPEYPHEEMLYDPYKVTHKEGLCALYYYEEPGDIKFKVLEYDEWTKKYSNEHSSLISDSDKDGVVEKGDDVNATVAATDSSEV